MSTTTGVRVLSTCAVLLLLLLSRGLPSPAAAQSEADSMRAPTVDTTAGPPVQSADWLVLPFASYAPATKVAVGIVGGYYLPTGKRKRPSSVQVSVMATQRRQLVVQLRPEVYLAEGRWRVQGDIVASKYPDVLFGIGGETPPAAEESYTAQYGRLEGTAQREVRPNLRVGPRVFLRAGTITDADEGGLVERGVVPGAEGGVNAGIGLSALWDARDNIYFPTEGTYAEVISTWYSAAWGSTYTFGHVTGDVRGYRSVGPGTVAGQAYAEAVVGQAPFPLLPLLGGSERMRGYREGRFRDDVYWTLQTEYRLPLLWRFKGSVFASAGEVGPRLGPDLVTGIETAVGAGGRVQFTEGGVHGRLDVAYSRTGVELYVALGEAF